MKEKIKKIFKSIYGCDKNIIFTVSCASLVTSIILLLFSIILDNQYNQPNNIFTYASSFFLAIWLIGSKGIDAAGDIGIEFFAY